jgi:hypothetical protein
MARNGGSPRRAKWNMEKTMNTRAGLKTLSVAFFAAVTLSACLSESADVGDFDGKGPYTKAQRGAITNCLDLAKRSARGRGYAMPSGDPQDVTRAGEDEFAVTWTFDHEPKQYQCIVRRNGEAHMYFWG